MSEYTIIAIIVTLNALYVAGTVESIRRKRRVMRELEQEIKKTEAINAGMRRTIAEIEAIPRPW